MEQRNKNRKLEYVEVKMLCPSKILPLRESSEQLVKSIRRDGIQQPIIVRPSPFEEGTYEIIDGFLRHGSLESDDKVLVDIRYDIDDAGVFSLSEATFKRKPRNTYERALFYAKWVKIVEASFGGGGSQKKVAEEANLSEAEISHYLSINELFERLKAQNVSEAVFNALKIQGVNKLYESAKVQDDSTLLKVAEIMGDHPNMTLEQLTSFIERQPSEMSTMERLAMETAEEDESIRVDRLTNITRELAGTLEKAKEALMKLTSKIASDPCRFAASDSLKRISTMLNSLRRIEKEAHKVIRSGRKTHDSGR